jgi:HupE / UreJ protein
MYDWGWIVRKEERMFFFEKKNQKTLVTLARSGPTLGANKRKFFASFFQKRSLLLAFLLFPVVALAHSASTAYLQVDASQPDVAVQLSVPLRDLEYAIGLDSNGDGDITWGELQAHAGAIDAYAMARLRFSADGSVCAPGPVTHLADRLNDGGYAVLRFSARCASVPRQLGVHYGLLFDQDRLHRGLLHVRLGGGEHAAALSPESPDAVFDAAPNLGATARQFFLTGVDHLLTGIDHMLFITMLLVPAMFRRSAQGGLQPVGKFGGAFIETLKVLSAFTIAHATTLTLSALHIVSIPERLSESGIALTIIVTAADNVWHFIPGRRWKLALVFGLVHGLGFATALGPLDLPLKQMAVALLSFNLGLEAAQVSIAAAVLPLGFLARRTLFYPRVVLPGLSGAVGAVAMAWFVDRAGDFGFMPF